MTPARLRQRARIQLGGFAVVAAVVGTVRALLLTGRPLEAAYVAVAVACAGALALLVTEEARRGR